MYNPYPPYEKKYLPEFKKKGVKCFVLQTYDRGRNLLEADPRPAYLLCHYDDITHAREHMDALKHDLRARILMMNEEADVRELLRLGESNAPERVYMYFKPQNGERTFQKLMEKKIRAYIDLKLRWHVPGGSTVALKLDFIFGEIYVELRHSGKYHKVKLEEIESMHGYVL